MRVKAKDVDWDSLDKEVIRFAKPDQTFTTPGEEYEVLAMSIYQNVRFNLICDDRSLAALIPAELFSQVTTDMPPEWICNTGLGMGVELVIGPPCVAKDLEAYGGMVERYPDVIDEVWKFYRVLQARASGS